MCTTSVTVILVTLGNPVRLLHALTFAVTMGSVTLRLANVIVMKAMLDTIAACQ
jgi:hypothetical protein